MRNGAGGRGGGGGGGGGFKNGASLAKKKGLAAQNQKKGRTPRLRPSERGRGDGVRRSPAPKIFRPVKKKRAVGPCLGWGGSCRLKSQKNLPEREEDLRQ